MLAESHDDRHVGGDRVAAGEAQHAGPAEVRREVAAADGVLGSRDRDVGRLTIKKRGTAVEPAQLRRQLRLTGSQEATVVLTRVGGQQSVLVVRPMETGSAP